MLPNHCAIDTVADEPVNGVWEQLETAPFWERAPGIHTGSPPRLPEGDALVSPVIYCHWAAVE